MTWLAFKTIVGPLLSGLWRFLTDPRVLAALAALALVAGSYGLGIRNGRLDCESAHQAAVIASQAAALNELNTSILAARDNAAQLARDTKALHAGAEAARREIANVLPPPAADHGCDLPAAARGLLNRSSGYPD